MAESMALEPKAFIFHPLSCSETPVCYLMSLLLRFLRKMGRMVITQGCCEDGDHVSQTVPGRSRLGINK